MIIGGVIGGVTVLMVISLLIFLSRHRHRFSRGRLFEGEVSGFVAYDVGEHLLPERIELASKQNNHSAVSSLDRSLQARELDSQGDGLILPEGSARPQTPPPEYVSL